jgi:hypothetical protein
VSLAMSFSRIDSSSMNSDSESGSEYVDSLSESYEKSVGYTRG